MSFAVSSSIRPPTARLDVHGELDLFTATQVGRTIDLAMEQGCREVLVDASEVTFVNGSALGVLIRTVITLDSSAASLRFVSVSPKFERLCLLTGIEEILGLRPLTVPEAPVFGDGERPESRRRQHGGPDHTIGTPQGVTDP